MMLPLMAAAQSAEFPYSKIFNMTRQELLAENFKYNANKNQYVLDKTNGWNIAAGVMTGDVQPHENDYTIVVQYDQACVTSLVVTFFNTSLYHELLSFAADNGENLLETGSMATHKTQFNYEGLMFELSSSEVSYSKTESSAVGVAVADNAAVAVGSATTHDRSYEIYTYIIDTGLAPASKWHSNEAAKQQRRDEKGRKKRTAAEYL